MPIARLTGAVNSMPIDARRGGGLVGGVVVVLGGGQEARARSFEKEIGYHVRRKPREG